MRDHGAPPIAAGAVETVGLYNEPMVVAMSVNHDLVKKAVIEADYGLTLLPQHSILSSRIATRPMAEPVCRDVELMHVRDRPHHPVVMELGKFLANYNWPE
ncbi:MAG: hypothetical protein ACKVGZ_17145 [Alphaproteobacteria bacterium]